MNKVWIGLVFIMVALVSFGEPGQRLWSGGGVQLVAATNAQVYTIPATNYAKTVSVHNAGTSAVFFVKSSRTNAFVASTSIPVAPGASYNSIETAQQITAITYATTNGTSLINIAFE